MAYVYQHIRDDSNTIFYIGIGENDKNNFKRAYSKYYRNKYWHNITNKITWKVKILHTSLSWEEACFLETKYILLYGRKDLGTGTLVNMTNGGDGGKKMIFTEEMRIKQRAAKVCKKIFGLSPENKVVEFESINNAANITKVYKTNILSCLKDTYIHTNGWKFSYNSTFNQSIIKIRGGKPIYRGIYSVGNKWRVQIKLSGKLYQSKLFTSIEDTIKERDRIIINNNLKYKI